MALGVGSGIRAEKRGFKRDMADASAKSRMEEITHKAEETARLSRPGGVTETPSEAVPYLPESKERGPMGDIMRASPQELGKIYEGMPVEERPVEVIRGTERTYWNPQTKKEYGSKRVAMTGFRQRPEAERARASSAGGGMTAYQTATLGQKERESGFKESQAKLEFISEGLKSRFAAMAAIGKQPNENQITSESAKLRNQWIKAHYSKKEARAMIAQNPTELRRDDVTGEEMWYNEYGEPVDMIGGGQEQVGGEVPPLGGEEVLSWGDGSAAARLRKQFERENAAPLIGSKTLGAFREAMGNRRMSPPVEEPSRLRGYMSGSYR